MLYGPSISSLWGVGMALEGFFHTMYYGTCSYTYAAWRRYEDTSGGASKTFPWLRDLTNVSEYGCGRKRRSDAKGTVSKAVEPVPKVMKVHKKLQDVKRKHPWRVHQSMATVRKRCCWKDCPGRTEQDSKLPYYTIMKCEECSIKEGRDMYFCNTVKKGKEYTTLPYCIPHEVPQEEVQLGWWIVMFCCVFVYVVSIWLPVYKLTY